RPRGSRPLLQCRRVPENSGPYIIRTGERGGFCPATTTGEGQCFECLYAIGGRAKGNSRGAEQSARQALLFAGFRGSAWAIRIVGRFSDAAGRRQRAALASARDRCLGA